MYISKNKILMIVFFKINIITSLRWKNNEYKKKKRLNSFCHFPSFMIETYIDNIETICS